MTKSDILTIAGVPVRYDGEGLGRFWFTLLVPGKETSFCLPNCSVRTIARAIKNALTRYSNHTAIA
jgi:hypothetical protein